MRTATCVLLIVLSVFAAACNDDAPAPAGQPPAPPELVSPRGATETPFLFTWKPVPGPSPIYRVQVTDAAERVLFEQDVRKTTCRPTSELMGMMADRASFTWTVSVMSEDGLRVVARSAPVQFSLK